MSAGLTFDRWAQAIGTHVLEAFPKACVKRKVDDVYRWCYEGRECQVHAVSDGMATFVVLARERMNDALQRAENVDIDENTQADVARRIVGWLNH